MILFFFSVPFWAKYSEIVEKTNPGPGLWDYPPNHVHRESSLWQLSPTSWAAQGLQLWGKGRVQLLEYQMFRPLSQWVTDGSGVS